MFAQLHNAKVHRPRQPSVQVNLDQRIVEPRAQTGQILQVVAEALFKLIGMQRCQEHPGFSGLVHQDLFRATAQGFQHPFDAQMQWRGLGGCHLMARVSRVAPRLPHSPHSGA
ncbi:hypothetical protein, partial [Boseongicola aestuarii]|uniref:hypothetical protein n=1 Tax=Boseongicola aestuarii TaxID=1470561 RepID=UPI001C3D3974